MAHIRLHGEAGAGSVGHLNIVVDVAPCGGEGHVALSHVSVGQFIDHGLGGVPRALVDCGAETVITVRGERDVFEQFRLLANEVSWRLRQNRLMGRTITIKIRYASFKTITRSLTLQSMGTCSEEQLYFSAKRLYNKSRGHEPIRLLGLTVSQLQSYQVQGDLFSEDEETKAKVTEAIDKLQKRFGRTAIMKGFLWEMSHEKDT